MALLLLAILPLLGCPRQSSTVAEGGVVDLRGSNLHDSIYSLAGPYEFYWRNLPDPVPAPGKAAIEALQPDQYLLTPGFWNEPPYDYPRQGYATFRLRILLPADLPRELALDLADPHGAYRLYLNGELVSESGTFATDAAAESLQRGASMVRFHPRDPELEVLIQMSNHVHLNAGFWDIVRLGDAGAMTRARELGIALNLLSFGALSIIGLYHLILAFYRREEPVALFFGAFCLMLAIRSILTGEQLFQTMFPGVPLGFEYRLELLAFYISVPLITLYFHHLFPGEFRRVVVRSVVLVSGLFCLGLVATPLFVGQATIRPYQLFTLLTGLFILFGLALAVRRGRTEAGALLAGMGVLLLAFIHDTLYVNGVIQSAYISSPVFLGFVLLQAVLLSRRSVAEYSSLQRTRLKLEQEGLRADLSLFHAERARWELIELNEISRRIAESMSIPVIMEMLHEFVHGLYRLDYCALYLMDFRERKLVCKYGLFPGQSTEFTAFVLRTPMPTEGGGVHASVVGKKRYVYLPKIRRASGVVAEDSIVERAGLKSFVSIPLIVGDRVIGVIDFSRADRKAGLSRSDISRISIICDQIAGAIHASGLLDQVQKEKDQSERLLLNILPVEVAQELKEKGNVRPVNHESATIMFTDLVGFSRVARKLGVEELLEELDGCFFHFDETIQRYKLEKLKTIGDSYMCAGGLPVPNRTHPVDACLAALEIQNFMVQTMGIKLSMGHDFWEQRLGVHTGPVIAGVIGKNKFAYDVWGDAVNVAARMEASGEPGRINISQDTYDLVQDFFECQYRGEIEVKNRGALGMYFLEGIKTELSEYGIGRVPNAKFREMYARLAERPVAAIREA